VPIEQTSPLVDQRLVFALWMRLLMRNGTGRKNLHRARMVGLRAMNIENEDQLDRIAAAS
jgi:hypothetical protein